MDKTIVSIINKIPTKLLFTALFILSTFFSFFYNLIAVNFNWPLINNNLILTSVIVFVISSVIVIFYLINSVIIFFKWLIRTKREKRETLNNLNLAFENTKELVFQTTDCLNEMEIKLLNELLESDEETIESKYHLFDVLISRRIVGVKPCNDVIDNEHNTKSAWVYWINDSEFKKNLKLVKNHYGRISRFKKELL